MCAERPQQPRDEQNSHQLPHRIVALIDIYGYVYTYIYMCTYILIRAERPRRPCIAKNLHQSPRILVLADMQVYMYIHIYVGILYIQLFLYTYIDVSEMPAAAVQCEIFAPIAPPYRCPN